MIKQKYRHLIKSNHYLMTCLEDRFRTGSASINFLLETGSPKMETPEILKEMVMLLGVGMISTEELLETQNS